jgi:hypothetical protein
MEQQKFYSVVMAKGIILAVSSIIGDKTGTKEMCSVLVYLFLAVD